ncbi:MAG: hypothetical protein M3N16_03915, partial [Actinomycetota bacterium]|nr:hypothetical protein [Actinomycetota bacterium]
RACVLLALLWLAFGLSGPGGAAAHAPPDRPGGVGSSSHTEKPRNGIEEVGFHPLLGTGFNTDVWAHATRDDRLFAYAGTWGTLTGFAAEDPCPSETDNPDDPRKSGVKVVNATDPARPRLAARLGSPRGAQNNDVKVARVDIPGGFSGDILAHSLEPCGAEGLLFQVLGSPFTDVPVEQTGFQLYDVSDPDRPRKLGAHNNGGIGTHNLYPFTRPDLGRAFVAAVFNEIEEPLGEVRGELQLVDISDPGAPRQVSTWELEDGPIACDARGTDSQFCFLHDVWTSPDGKTAYLSFWDAGLVLLDISNPDAKPRLIGQAQRQVEGDGTGWLDEEGNTHAAVPMRVGDRDLVIVGDEDFTGPGDTPYATVDDAPAGAQVSRGEHLRGTEFSATRPLSEGAVGSFPALRSDDEHGCSYATAAAIRATLDGWIAVARRGGPCPLFQDKVARAEAAGADGLIVVNDQPGSTSGLAASVDMPAIMIGKPEGDRLIASIDNTRPEAVKLTLELLRLRGDVDPWGFMRVVDVTSPDPANWRQTSTFKAPHVDDPDQPAESVFSAHNPIPGPDGRVYFAWYTDGVRVLEPDAASGAFRETAWFVPRPSDHPDDLDSDPHGAQEDNVGFWGSKAVCNPRTGDLLIFNSDLNRGLYILKPANADKVGGGRACPAAPAPRAPRAEADCPATGTPGRDTLDGGLGDDCLNGLGGDDTLAGGSGDDRLDGADEVDVAAGDAGNDSIAGGRSRDFLSGDVGGDSIDAGPGGDVVDGGIGNDVVRGAGSGDSLNGGSDEDRISGGGGRDGITGASGNDRLFGGQGPDRVEGGLGADLISGGAGADSVVATDGKRDRVRCGGGRDTVLADGVDRVARDCERVLRSPGGSRTRNPGSGTPETQDPQVTQAGRGGERVEGARERNCDLRGSAGNDTIDSLGAGDCLFGLGGLDLLSGGTGDDRADGGEGSDVLAGGPGDDTLLGGGLRDFLSGGPGTDRIDGGGGPSVANGAQGNDVLLGGDAIDSLNGGADEDRISGRGGRDGITGASGDDRLFGGDGPDRLEGGLGADAISGGAGDDSIVAADGKRDRVRCGGGRDVVWADRGDRLAGDCERVLSSRG